MRKCFTKFILLLGALIIQIEVQAQTPVDAIMMKKREFCVAAAYDHGSWDHYWEGRYLRTNGNIGTLTRTTVMPMVAFGLWDRVNLLASLPYVATRSSGGQLAGVSGLQDLSLFVKATVYEREFGSAKGSVLAVGGFSRPVSNYLSDYQPYSLGLGTTEWNARAIAQYRLGMGLYVRGSVAYLHRGNTRAERDYYYANGSYYTNLMDVPNAWTYQGALGIWLINEDLKLEATYTSQRSMSGDDIRAYNAPQPTNRVDIDQLGGSIQYYPPFVKGFGVFANTSQIVNGRNMGKFINFGVGATYQFSL